jgi:hypothetical protein
MNEATNGWDWVNQTGCGLDGRNCAPGCCQPKAEAPVDLPESAKRIAEKCDALKALLVEKNLAYGNSALEPVRIFSKADAVEQLRVRADDKLSRITKGSQYQSEDHLLDLAGYLVLMMVALDE